MRVVTCDLRVRTSCCREGKLDAIVASICDIMSSRLWLLSFKVFWAGGEDCRWGHLASGMARASRIGMVRDGGADVVVMVVSFDGVLNIAWTCWKTGGGSAGNCAWVCAVVDVQCMWYTYQR